MSAGRYQPQATNPRHHSCLEELKRKVACNNRVRGMKAAEYGRWTTIITRTTITVERTTGTLGTTAPPLGG